MFVEEKMDTLNLQDQPKTQADAGVFNSKNFQIVTIIIVVAVISSLTTWYLLTHTSNVMFQPNDNTSQVVTSTNVKKDKLSSNTNNVFKNTNTDIKLDRIKDGSTISSPVIFRGTVSPEWMFEGQFTVQVVGSDGQIIAQAPVKELYEGAWQEDYPVEFESRVEFVTDETSGELVFRNANPSGLSQNEKIYKVFVRFAKKDFQSLLKNICKYQGENVYPNYTFKIADLPFTSSKLLGEDGFCIPGYTENNLYRGYLTLDLFDSNRKYEILVYDEASSELGHGGPSFLGYWGQEIYNNENLRVGASLSLPEGGPISVPNDFVAVFLRGEVSLTPDTYETMYINTSVDLEMPIDKNVQGIINKYAKYNKKLDVKTINWDDFDKYSNELITYYFIDNNLGKKQKGVLETLISTLKSFHTK